MIAATRARCTLGSAALEAVGLERVSVWRGTPRGRKDILREVDWTVERGERWVVLGPNGAGKSTLLRIISARMRPSSGVARILGRQVGRYPLAQLHREIGLVDPALGRRFYPDQRAIDVVETGWRARSCSSRTRHGGHRTSARI